MPDKINAEQQEKITVYIDSDLEDIVPEFLAGKQNDIQIFLQFLKEKNFEKIGMEGHKMKGEGMGYGFDLISDVGAALESLAQEKNIEGIKSELDKLNLYISSLNIVYQDMD
jgi:hypothetical protein